MKVVLRTRRTVAIVTVALASLLLLAVVTNGSAASLGELAADNLTAMSLPSARCDDEVNVAGARNNPSTPEGSFDTMVLTNVAEECDGLLADLTAYAFAGVLLAMGSATAAEGTFQVTLNTPVLSSSLYGVALVIGGGGIPTVLAGGLFQTSWVIYQQNRENYCAEVTVTTTSPVEVAWEVQLAMDAYPLTGTPFSVWHGVQVAWNPPTLVVAGEYQNLKIDAEHPTWFNFCANRPPGPAPVGEVDWAVTAIEEGGGGYCATISVTTTSLEPVTWFVEMDLSSDAFPVYPVENPTTSSQVGLDFSSPPNLKVMSDGDLHYNTIWGGLDPSGPRTFNFCVEGDGPIPPGDLQLTSFVFTSAWGSGYCVNYVLTNTTQIPIIWELQFDLSNNLIPWVDNPSLYLPPGPPYESLQVKFPQVTVSSVNPFGNTYVYNAPILTLRGPGNGTGSDWNDYVYPNSPRHSGFCIN